MASTKILVVDDDPAIRNLVSRYLSQQNYHVESAEDGETALAKFAQFNPDLVVLDLNLPDTTGFKLCYEMQSQTSVLVLMLTSLKDKIVEGFKKGADDYLTKPFDLEELHVRIQALLKRQRPPTDKQPKTLVYEDLVIDPNRREVLIKGKLVALSPLEFKLFYCLANTPGRAWERSELVEEVWGYKDDSGGRTIDVHIGKIRKKIETLSDKPSWIKTVTGVGYMFDRRN